MDEFRAAGHGRYESDLHGMPWGFLRWATWKVFEAARRMPAGAVAFVVPSSVITSRAFRGLREYLRRRCDLGWVIELTPEGNRPPTATRVFGPEVGRRLCILVFARKAGAESAEAKRAQVRYLELQGTRTEKVSVLAGLTTTDPRWRLCDDG
ncbi:hypothetical protein [Actinomadura parmotrematis]|uniref:Uncharacterized protein n=1 Tax=Actinomadura parmotrematis TaxID=2864039 RepID=A0ABS7FVC0_9ACTN|nr:hypothetical protein [Actinomadura parmotrematis]MBW8484276.1 hypothetical protein [Actinomadura parmotrematis]